jgi:hypothetical protein
MYDKVLYIPTDKFNAAKEHEMNNQSTQLDKMEYQLKQTWHKAQATADKAVREQIITEYRKLHAIYKKQLVMNGLK